MKREIAEPETRVDNCCGDGCNTQALLFKIQGIYRYGPCYQKETGHRHHLDDSPLRTSVIITP